MVSEELPRVLVAQIGSRRRYAVPLGLDRAGGLSRMITDASSSVSPWSYIDRVVPRRLRRGGMRRLLDRRIEGVDPSKIRSCFFRVFLASRIGDLRRRRGEPRVDWWLRQNKTFATAVSRQDWGDANCVYAFNGAALEIFEYARRCGLRCVLDQTAAPWRFNSDLLKRESVRWPDWEAEPSDCDSGGQMIAREEAEWALADRIVCGSQFVVDAIRRVGGPAEKCTVVPYPTPELPANLERQTGQDFGRLRVLFVGTLQLRKGIQYVWDVAGRLGQAGVQFRAVGPSHLSVRAEDAVRQRIDWVGSVSRSEVWEHYLWADVMLLPTLSEGSANVCWEALASGTPVITTHAAGLGAAEAELTTSDTDAIECSLRRRQVQREQCEVGDRRVRSVVDYGADLLKAMM